MILEEAIKIVNLLKEQRFNHQLYRRIILFQLMDNNKHLLLKENLEICKINMAKTKDYKDKKLSNQKMKKSNWSLK